MEVPGYPGCPIRFDYGYRTCQPSGKIEYRIIGFTWPPSADPNCTALLSALNNSSTKDATIRELEEKASQVLPSVLFMNAYNAAFPGDKPNYECPNGRVIYRGIISSCERYVEIKRTVERPWGQEIVEWIVRFENCNDEACCVELRELCYNTSTNQLEETVSISTNTDLEPCDPLAPPTDPDAIWWTPCLTRDCPTVE
jgi:hypothetical protein